jgi:serine phosphatase RsbU (regulator of sigma subunit)
VFEDAQFEAGSVQLCSGDKLLLYSDGAEPFMGSKHNDIPLNFGKEFMNIAALPAKQLAAEFENLVRASKDTTELDDITLIALEIQ